MSGDGGVFGGGVEAGAGFGGKVAVGVDDGTGELAFEGDEEFAESPLLVLGPGVGRKAVGVDAADVAHAY